MDMLGKPPFDSVFLYIVILSLITSIIILGSQTSKISYRFAISTLIVLHILYVSFIRFYIFSFKQSFDEQAVFAPTISSFIETGSFEYPAGPVLVMIIAYLSLIFGLEFTFHFVVFTINIIYLILLIYICNIINIAKENQVILMGFIISLDWFFGTIGLMRPNTFTALLLLIFLYILLKLIKGSSNNQVFLQSSNDNTDLSHLEYYRVLLLASGMILFFIHLVGFLLWFVILHFILFYLSFQTINKNKLTSCIMLTQIKNTIKLSIIFSGFVLLTIFLVYKRFMSRILINKLSKSPMNINTFVTLWLITVTLILIDWVIVWNLERIIKRLIVIVKYIWDITRQIKVITFALFLIIIIMFSLLNSNIITRGLTLHSFEINQYTGSIVLILLMHSPKAIFMILLISTIVTEFRKKSCLEKNFIHIFVSASILLSIVFILFYSVPAIGKNNWGLRFLRLGIPYMLLSFFTVNPTWFNKKMSRFKLTLLFLFCLWVGIVRLATIFYSYTYP